MQKLITWVSMFQMSIEKQYERETLLGLRYYGKKHLEERETVHLRGRPRSVYRDIKTGRFTKKP